MSEIIGSVYVVMLWDDHPYCKIGKCSPWTIIVGGCAHKPPGSYVAKKIYTKPGPARSYITTRKNDKARRRSVLAAIPDTEAPAEIEARHPGYILTGEIADLVRLDADAQARAEHFESRALAHAMAAMALAKEPVTKKRKRGS